jgi:trehalose-6-phosphatase
LANHDVKIVSQIQGSIELAPRELHKGVMVRRLFEKVLAVRAGKLPAFTVIVGDEPSDDAMVTELVDTLAKAAPFAGVSELKSFMITVGKRKSPSPLYLNDVKEVEQILAEFAAVSLSS